MSYLSEDQRAAILKTLESAPDDILIDAIVRFKDYHCGLLSDWEGIRKFVGGKPSSPMPEKPAAAPVAQKTVPEPVEITEPQERPNVSPGEPTTTKIGSAAKAFIFEVLEKRDAGFDHFGDKYEAHLKLLWSRGEIGFDGKEFYV